MVFGHFALAAIGLVVWIIHLVAGGAGLAWTALVLLVPVAALGFAMFFRWIGTRRAHPAAAATGTAPAERHFPVVVVIAHGLLAVVTVVLVLLSALAANA